MKCPLKFCSQDGSNCLKSHGLFLGFVVLALIIWLFKFNQPLFYLINSWHVIMPPVVWKSINFVAESKTFILPIFLLAITFIWRKDQLKRVIILIIAYYLLFSGLKVLFGEARPFVVLPADSFYFLGNPEEALKVAYKSFPSGHTGNMAIFVFTLSSFVTKKSIKVLLFLLLVLTAFARIYTGWHWPLDVIASGLIGYLLVQICLCSAKLASVTGTELEGRLRR